MDLPSDLIDRLSAFAEERVDYLLVDGQAVALHGVPRFTKDADLWLRDSHENLDRATRSLEAFGAPLGTLRALDEAQGLDVVWIGHPPARIDLMKQVPGGDFDAAFRARETFVVAGVVVSCISKADLIAQKRASGRPQDLVDAANLERRKSNHATARRRRVTRNETPQRADLVNRPRTQRRSRAGLLTTDFTAPASSRTAGSSSGLRR